MTEPDPRELVEAKLIYAPQRVWKAIERIAAGERRNWRDLAAMYLEQATRKTRKPKAKQVA